MVCPCGTNNTARGMQVAIPAPLGTCFQVGQYRAAWCFNNINATCTSCPETFFVNPCEGEFECPVTVTFPVLHVTGTAQVIVSREIQGNCQTVAAISESVQNIIVDFTCVLCAGTDCQSIADAFNANPCDFLTFDLEGNDLTGPVTPVVSLNCAAIRGAGS